MTRRFNSVALDVDSTLTGIEGIDWLAALRGEEIARSVADATARAMKGESPLEDVYGMRMQLVSPTLKDLELLTEAYRSAIAPGASEEIAKWRDSGVRVVLVSGGLRAAILPFAADLGFTPDHIYALDAGFDQNGKFAGFDTASPLCSSTGKKLALEQLGLPRPILAVGDGMTDVAMKDVADSFAAFTGFATRDAVLKHADFVVTSFADLTGIVLGE